MPVIIATFQAAPGKEAELEAALLAMIEPVRAEDGVLEYTLHRSPTIAGSFLFYERYRDQATIESHSATPYLAALLARVPELCAQPPVITTYEPVASIND
ncbi:MAG: antibiotic biosynthesis monooxygenase [Cellulomonas sp.]|nr:antibiotic biosynthesis monooxygenase [Cellulomonas sp.]